MSNKENHQVSRADPAWRIGWWWCSMLQCKFRGVEGGNTSHVFLAFKGGGNYSFTHAPGVLFCNGDGTNSPGVFILNCSFFNENSGRIRLVFVTEPAPWICLCQVLYTIWLFAVNYKIKFNNFIRTLKHRNQTTVW